jgi:hypothetical protein
MPSAAAENAAPPVIRRAALWSADLTDLDPDKASRLRELVQRAYYSGKREAYSNILGAAKGELINQGWVRERMYEAQDDLRQTEERLRKLGVPV